MLKNKLYKPNEKAQNAIYSIHFRCYNGIKKNIIRDYIMDCKNHYCYYWKNDSCEFQEFSEQYLGKRYDCYYDFEEQLIKNRNNLQY